MCRLHDEDTEFEGLIFTDGFEHGFKHIILTDKSINETEKVTVCEIWHDGVFIGVSTGFKTQVSEEVRLDIEKESRKRFDKTISDRLKRPGVNPYRDPI